MEQEKLVKMEHVFNYINKIVLVKLIVIVVYKIHVIKENVLMHAVIQYAG